MMCIESCRNDTPLMEAGIDSRQSMEVTTSSLANLASGQAQHTMCSRRAEAFATQLRTLSASHTRRDSVEHLDGMPDASTDVQPRHACCLLPHQEASVPRVQCGQSRRLFSSMRATHDVWSLRHVRRSPQSSAHRSAHLGTAGSLTPEKGVQQRASVRVSEGSASIRDEQLTLGRESMAQSGTQQSASRAVQSPLACRRVTAGCLTHTGTPLAGCGERSHMHGASGPVQGIAAPAVSSSTCQRH